MNKNIRSCVLVMILLAGIVSASYADKPILKRLSKVAEKIAKPDTTLAPSPLVDEAPINPSSDKTDSTASPQKSSEPKKRSLRHLR